jgi:hypothetical protein
MATFALGEWDGGTMKNVTGIPDWQTVTEDPK